MMLLMKKMLFTIIYGCCFFLILLGLIELLYSMKIIQPSFHMHGIDVVLEKDILYRIKPNSAPDINRFGYRTHEYDLKKDKKRIVFLGDSFVMGTDIAAHEAIPQQLETLLKEQAEVINMGVLGYGPDQSLVQIHQDVLKLDPDLVILGIYPRNDFKDIARNNLFHLNFYDHLAPSGNNIVEEIYPSLNLVLLWDFIAYKFGWADSKYDTVFTKLFGDNNDYFLFFPTLRFNKMRFKAMHRIIEEINEVLTENEIAFMVVIFPSQESVENKMALMEKSVHPDRVFYGEDLIYTICESLGIHAVNLYPTFLAVKKEESRYTVDKTFHFTPETAKEVAGIIKKDVLNKLNLKQIKD